MGSSKLRLALVVLAFLRIISRVIIIMCGCFATLGEKGQAIVGSRVLVAIKQVGDVLETIAWIALRSERCSVL